MKAEQICNELVSHINKTYGNKVATADLALAVLAIGISTLQDNMKLPFKQASIFILELLVKSYGVMSPDYDKPLQKSEYIN